MSRLLMIVSTCFVFCSGYTVLAKSLSVDTVQVRVRNYTGYKISKVKVHIAVQSMCSRPELLPIGLEQKCGRSERNFKFDVSEVNGLISFDLPKMTHSNSFTFFKVLRHFVWYQFEFPELDGVQFFQNSYDFVADAPTVDGTNVIQDGFKISSVYEIPIGKKLFNLKFVSGETLAEVVGDSSENNLSVTFAQRISAGGYHAPDTYIYKINSAGRGKCIGSSANFEKYRCELHSANEPIVLNNIISGAFGGDYGPDPLVDYVFSVTLVKESVIMPLYEERNELRIFDFHPPWERGVTVQIPVYDWL